MPRAVSIFLAVLSVFIYTSTVSAADIPRMTTDQLKSDLNASAIVILDVRGSWDWVKTDDKIAGAIRVDPGKANQWAGDFSKEKTIVLYCA